jgi:hypothetical protein
VWRWLIFLVACESTPGAPEPAVTAAIVVAPCVATPPLIATPHTACIRDEIELAVVVARPRHVMFHPEAEIREDHGHLAACNAQGCNPLGGKLAKEIADILASEASEEPGDGRVGPLRLEVTRDHALVCLSNTNMEPQLWNVTDDKPIEPQEPSSFHRFAEAHVVAALPVGDAMMMMWAGCRSLDVLGSCGMDAEYWMTLVDALGHDLDGENSEFESVVQAAPDRYVASGDTVQLIEHGKVVASRAFTVVGSNYSSKPRTQIVHLDDDHVALLFHSATGWRLLAVALAKALPEVELAHVSLKVS